MDKTEIQFKHIAMESSNTETRYFQNNHHLQQLAEAFVNVTASIVSRVEDT